MNQYFVKPDRYFYAGGIPIPSVKQVRIPETPAFLHGMRALFISDVHLRPGVSKKSENALSDLLHMQDADLLLLGGDYGETKLHTQRFFDMLSATDFPMGAFAVLGNNDRHLYTDVSEFRRLLEKSGCRLLMNESETVDRKACTLAIGGCDDHLHGHPSPTDIFPETADCRILLSHFPILPPYQTDLILSGHTHAGQFNFLGITPYTIGFEYRYHIASVKGLSRFADTQLFVGNGIGMSKLPFRIGAAPEIYLLQF